MSSSHEPQDRDISRWMGPLAGGTIALALVSLLSWGAYQGITDEGPMGDRSAILAEKRQSAAAEARTDEVYRAMTGFIQAQRTAYTRDGAYAGKALDLPGVSVGGGAGLSVDQVSSDGRRVVLKAKAQGGYSGEIALFTVQLDEGTVTDASCETIVRGAGETQETWNGTAWVESTSSGSKGDTDVCAAASLLVQDKPIP